MNDMIQQGFTKLLREQQPGIKDNEIADVSRKAVRFALTLINTEPTIPFRGARFSSLSPFQRLLFDATEYEVDGESGFCGCEPRDGCFFAFDLRTVRPPQGSVFETPSGTLKELVNLCQARDDPPFYSTDLGRVVNLPLKDLAGANGRPGRQRYCLWPTGRKPITSSELSVSDPHLDGLAFEDVVVVPTIAVKRIISVIRGELHVHVQPGEALILYSRWFAAKLDALKTDLPQKDLLAWACSEPRKRRRKLKRSNTAS